MRITINKLKTKERGFTLLELLVTVSIVGILTSVAVPSFQDYKEKAYEAVALSAAADMRGVVVLSQTEDNDYSSNEGISAFGRVAIVRKLSQSNVLSVQANGNANINNGIQALKKNIEDILPGHINNPNLMMFGAYGFTFDH